MLLCLPVWGFLPYLGIDKSVAELGEAGDLRTLRGEPAARLELGLPFTGPATETLLGGGGGAEYGSDLLFLGDRLTGLAGKRTKQFLRPRDGLEPGTSLLRADTGSSEFLGLGCADLVAGLPDSLPADLGCLRLPDNVRGGAFGVEEVGGQVAFTDTVHALHLKHHFRVGVADGLVPFLDAGGELGGRYVAANQVSEIRFLVVEPGRQAGLTHGLRERVFETDVIALRKRVQTGFAALLVTDKPFLVLRRLTEFADNNVFVDDVLF